MFDDSRQGFLSKIRDQGQPHAYVSLLELRRRSPHVVPGVGPQSTLVRSPSDLAMEVVMVAIMTKKRG